MQVIFSEAWWIGKKEDNPDECRLPLPQSVIEAGRKAQGDLLESDQSDSLNRPLHCFVKFSFKGPHRAAEAEQPVAADEGKGTQGTANGRSTTVCPVNVSFKRSSTTIERVGFQAEPPGTASQSPPSG